MLNSPIDSNITVYSDIEPTITDSALVLLLRQWIGHTGSGYNIDAHTTSCTDNHGHSTVDHGWWMEDHAFRV